MIIIINIVLMHSSYNNLSYMVHQKIEREMPTFVYRRTSSQTQMYQMPYTLLLPQII